MCLCQKKSLYVLVSRKRIYTLMVMGVGELKIVWHKYIINFYIMRKLYLYILIFFSYSICEDNINMFYVINLLSICILRLYDGM